MQESLDTEATLELLADSYAREVMNQLGDGPTAAPELVERCPFSRTTVYRRLDELEAAGLVDVTLELRRDGNHRRVYEPAIEELRVSVSDDGVTGAVREAAPTA